MKGQIDVIAMHAAAVLKISPMIKSFNILFKLIFKLKY